MGTGSLQFFICVEESNQILEQLVKKFGYWLILERYRGSGPTLYDLTGGPEFSGQISVDSYDQVFLTKTKPAALNAVARNISIAELGWLQFNLPKTNNDTLLLASFGCKSDWFDRNTREFYENTEIKKLYQQAKRLIIKRLNSPTWVKNVVLNASGLAKSVYYSDCAADWEKNGGKLRQRGVNNIAYSRNEFSEP